MELIGHDIPIHDARGKVTGRLKYAADKTMSRMAHIAMIFSTIPHGYVVSVDAGKALALPGVYGVFHCLNTEDYRFNRFRSQATQDELPQEEHVFEKYVRFVGDRVGAVAARDEETARRAAALVEVKYQELPYALSFDEALEGKNCLPGEEPVKSECFLETGEAEPDEAEGIEIVAETEIARLHHAAMETHVCIADYDPDLDELTIESPNQSVHGIRTVVADMLKLPYSRVRVIKATMGGSFGAKQEWMLEPVAAVLAKELRRPVKLVFDRAETMRSTICRGAMRAVLKARFRADGSILCMDLDLLSDAGGYIGNSAAYIRTLYGKMFRCYRVPHGLMHGRVVSTNTPVSGAYRGWTGPEAATMIEHVMEKAAKELNMDPVELRLKNVLLPGDTDHKSGLPMEEIRTRESLIQGAERFHWAERRRADAEFNAKNVRYKRGTGVGCGGHGNTYFPRYKDFAGVELRMCEDGSVQANISVHDHGCGSVTAFKMILAETLHLPMERIRLKEADSANTPFDFGCYASRSTFVVGRTAQRCAEKLREKIIEGAAEILDCPLDTLYYEGAVIRSKSDPELRFTYGDVGHGAINVLRREIFAEERGQNNSNPGVTGTHFAQVEVDTWTGITKVLSYLAVHDLGQTINRAMCIAQITGAAQQGCGAALREEIAIDPKGRSVNSLSKYHLMNAPALPNIDVLLIQEGRSKEGPFGAKSIGEVSFVPSAAAVMAAVNQALDSDMGMIPMSPDRIVEYLSKEEH